MQVADQTKSLADLGLTARGGRDAQVTGLAVGFIGGEPRKRYLRGQRTFERRPRADRKELVDKTHSDVVALCGAARVVVRSIPWNA